MLLTDIENFHPVYTEVEPFQDRTPRPVLIFGVAVEALIEQLLEEHPEAFVSPKTGKYIVGYVLHSIAMQLHTYV